MKKRFQVILFGIIAIMTLCILPITVNAEESGAEPIEIERNFADGYDVEESVAGIGTQILTASEELVEAEVKHYTFFSRIREFFCVYSEETLYVIGSVILLIFNLILKHSGSKTSKETKKNLEDIKGEVEEILGGQNSVVDVVNGMIDAYNDLTQKYDEMKEVYEQYGLAEGERSRIIGAVLSSTAAILDILTTVYANSKNLPQGLKDLVNLKYANFLKTLEDDKQLGALVESARNNITAASENGAESLETLIYDQQNER